MPLRDIRELIENDQVACRQKVKMQEEFIDLHLFRSLKHLEVSAALYWRLLIHIPRWNAADQRISCH